MMADKTTAVRDVVHVKWFKLVGLEAPLDLPVVDTSSLLDDNPLIEPSQLRSRVILTPYSLIRPLPNRYSPSAHYVTDLSVHGHYGAEEAAPAS
jgi:hypothetical protein